MNKLIAYFSRSQVWGFFLSMAVMVIISVCYFYPDNFDGNPLNQSDMLQGAANSHESQLLYEQTGEKALWTNSLFSGMPTFQISPSYSSNALFDWINGLYGLWLPAPSNLLFMMMFGFFILLYCMGLRWYYSLIGAVAWGFSSYFIIIIGAGHIWKFVTLSYIPPTIGGLVLCYNRRYVLGGALTALFAMLQLNANHPQMSYYFAFVMAGFVIVYLIQSIQHKTVKQWGIATTIVAAAGLLAIGANLPSIYNTYEYAKETKRTQSELTPLPAAQGESAERPTGGMPMSQIVGWSYGGSEMFTLMVPNVKGGATIKAVNGSPEIMSLSKLPEAANVAGQNQQLLQYFTQYFNDSESTNGPVYVGALICALFLLGCIIVRGPMKWCLVILTIFSMLLALGRNFQSLTDFMVYNFPMYNKFRAVESILVIAEFTMPLLAILALAQFMRSDIKGKVQPRKLYALYISFGFCALICLLGMLFPGMFGDVINSQDRNIFAQMQQMNMPTYDMQQLVEQLRYGMIRTDCLRSLMFIILGFAALWISALGKINKPTAITVLGVLVLIDMFGVDKRYLDSDNFLKVSPYAKVDASTPIVADAIDQQISADTTQSYRVLDIPGFTDPRRSYFHKMIGGYHAAKLNRYEDLIQRRMQHLLGYGYEPSLRVDSIVAQYSPEEQKVIREILADYHVMDMLNTKYIITGKEDYPVLLNSSALGNAWLIDEIKYVTSADDEMAALGTLDPAHQAVADKQFLSVLGTDVVKPQPGDTIYLTHYSPNSLSYRVKTAKGGVGVFSEVYFPWGWKAYIDDKEVPLARVNYILRAIKLPAGDHTVTMTFDPDSIHTSAAIAYACVTVIYLLIIAAIFFAVMPKKRKKDGVD